MFNLIWLTKQVSHSFEGKSFKGDGQRYEETLQERNYKMKYVVNCLTKSLNNPLLCEIYFMVWSELVRLSSLQVSI